MDIQQQLNLSPDEGMYFAGNVSVRVQRDGELVEVPIGYPVPEAFTFPAAQRYAMLTQGHLLVCVVPPCSKETLLELLAAEGASNPAEAAAVLYEKELAKVTARLRAAQRLGPIDGGEPEPVIEERLAVESATLHEAEIDSATSQELEARIYESGLFAQYVEHQRARLKAARAAGESLDPILVAHESALHVLKHFPPFERQTSPEAPQPAEAPTEEERQANTAFLGEPNPTKPSKRSKRTR